MNKTDPKVDLVFANETRWKNEMLYLRDILLSIGLEETYKWKQACYCYNGANIAIIYSFKEYCGLGFFKGAMLKDNHNLLSKANKNSQASRQFRFDSLEKMESNIDQIKHFLVEAIQVEKNNIPLPEEAKVTLEYPEELIQQFKKQPALKQAFEKLSPGRQRAYLIHFTGAKKSETRLNRILKYSEKILAGKGFQDR